MPRIAINNTAGHVKSQNNAFGHTRWVLGYECASIRGPGADLAKSASEKAEDGDVALLAAQVAFASMFLDKRQQIGIDCRGADGRTELPHGPRNCADEGLASVFHQAPAVSDPYRAPGGIKLAAPKNMQFDGDSKISLTALTNT